MACKLTFKNYLGYAITDLANNIGFAITSSYLTIFYIDVLGSKFDEHISSIWGIIITIIMVVARIWDGVNDPMMGFIAQKSKPTKYGKFRHFLLMGGIPLAFIFVLMFIPFKNMSIVGCAIFATITYILYGMIYTVVLVPYGSLATVMTRDANERSNLSIARSIGGGIGGIPAGMLFPLIIYDVTTIEGKETKVMNGNRFFVCILVIALIMLICYYIGFKNIKEQYPYTESENNTSIRKTFKGLLKNKPFIIMSLVGMLLIASSMFINTIDVYLFNVYYHKSGMMTFVTIATYIPMLVFVLFTKKIIKTIGKKEMCVIGLALATITSLIMWLYKIPSCWLYLLFVFLQGVGIGFITLEIWALAMDVIDYQEYLTNKRDEAPCYAIFTFMRKIGQALAAITPTLLTLVNYVSSKGYDGQSASTEIGIYNLATLIPFILFAIMLILMIFYPLNKKNDKMMREKLSILRKERENIVNEQEA